MQLKINVFIFFLTLSYQTIFSQTSFKTGFVLKTANDTLFGKIELRSEKYLAQKCRFLDNSNKITIFYPKDIIAYSFGKSNYYISKEIGNQKVFLQYLVKGKLNAFFLNNKSGDHYYIEKDSTFLHEIKFKEGIYRDDYKTYKYKTTEHIKTLQALTNEAPQLQNEIIKMKGPNHQNITSIASNYHYEVCKDSLCVVYERNKINALPILSLYTGQILYNKNVEGFKAAYPTFGITIDKPFERINNNLAFRTGVNFDLIKTNFSSKPFIKIPLQIIYNKPLKSFSPFFGYGVNIVKIKDNDHYKDTIISFLISAGILKEITQNIAFTINYEFEYLPKRYLPIYDKTLSNALKIGIRYKLGTNKII